MIEQFITTIVGALIGQGGGWLIAVLLGIVVYVMDKRLIEQKMKNDALVSEHYEKRIEEFRELVEVIGTSTRTIQSMQAVVNTSGESTNQLVQAFAKLMREVDSQRTAQSKSFSEMKKRIDALQKGRAA